MQNNRPFNNNPYITQNQNTPTDLGLNNQNPYINNTTQNQANSSDSSNLLGGFDTQKFLLGALVGAGAAYLLTNENAQKSIFKTVAKGSALFGAGIEEMKERFEDAKAEMEAGH